jgi:hypothetical protein
LDRSWLGWAELEPCADVIAGSLVNWKLVYHVGKYGIDDGGSIRIARRSVCDEEPPQFKEHLLSGYTSVQTSRDIRLEYFFSLRGHIRPFRAALQIDVRDGSLYEGDTVTIFFGDNSHGGPGIRAQSFREEERIFKVLVDPFGTGRFEEIEDSPSIRVIGGPADRIEVVTPSMVVSDKPFDVIVRALDSFGNRSDNYKGKIEFKGLEYSPDSYVFNETDRGAHRFTIKLKEVGLKTIKVIENNGRSAESNPLIVQAEEPAYKLFWGDMHGQTKQTVGTGSVDEYFSFLRDVAGMDFGGWQGNDFQITRELWDEVKKKTKQYTEPERFLLFLGYEWSGLTPAGGDYNIYFLGDDEEIFRSDHWLIEDRSDEKTDRYPINKLWEEFRGRRDVMAIAHVGGRHGNLDFWDSERVPLIEIHSHHGTFEWLLEDAIRRGIKVGFIATSDDHACRPGLTLTSGNFTTKGGYTAVYAKKLKKEALWEAFWSRRTYGTTGERIILDFRVNGHIMGEEIDTNTLPKIKVKVHGTKSLHSVDVMRGTETIFRHPFARPEDDNKIIKIEWMGARVRSRPKRVNWDGGLFIDKGRIIEYEEYAFDYVDQGVNQISNQRLTWTSTTGGDPDGVLIKLDAPDEATITFYSEPISFTFKPSEITFEPKIIEVGPVNQRVKIQAIKEEPIPKNIEFTITDKNIKKGDNPYWVKVTQSDGSMAWSSPVYVMYSDS